MRDKKGFDKFSFKKGKTKKKMKPKIKPIVTLLFGSHLYKLNTSESDIDLKAIYLPTSNDIIMGKVIPTFNFSSNDKTLAGEEDYEIYSLCKFLKMAKNGDTVALDMLHSTPSVNLESSEIWEYLVANRTKFYSKNMNSFMGYLKKQFLIYGEKGSKLIELENVVSILEKVDTSQTISDCIELLPNGKYIHFSEENSLKFYMVNDKLIQTNLTLEHIKESATRCIRKYGKRAHAAKLNNGSDWKSISHALRVAQQLLEIYKYGDYSYPLQNNDYLAKVKAGLIPYEDVIGSFDNVLKEVYEAADNSDLPDYADTSFIDKYLYDVYLNIILNDNGNRGY